MSSSDLEKQAKTLAELRDEAHRLEWHLDVSPLRRKWVPLEVAKQLEEMNQSLTANIEWTTEANRSQALRIKELKQTLDEILTGLETRLPIARKISQFDPETGEDWTIEVPDQFEYSRFFDWVDCNLTKWRKVSEE